MEGPGRFGRPSRFPSMMAQLAALREKYDLHMRVERYKSDDDQASAQGDQSFIRS